MHNDINETTKTLEEALEFIKEHEVKENVKFVTWITRKDFGCTDLFARRHKIYWSEDMTPYSIVNQKRMECQFGTDRNSSAKQMRNLEATKDILKKNFQDTKKSNCPASITIREITEYPDYQLPAGKIGHYKRSVASKYVREAIQQKSINYERKFSICISGAHSGHPSGKEPVIVKETVHADIAQYIQSVVWSQPTKDITIVEMKNNLFDYIKNVVFVGKAPPPKTEHQYFPTTASIRYYMQKAKSALCIDHIQREKLLNHSTSHLKLHNQDKLTHNFQSFYQLVTKESTETSVNTGEPEVDGDEESISVMKGNSENYEGDAAARAALFCHQTPHQQRLLRKYHSSVIITVLSDFLLKSPFPFYGLFVYTNVDVQLVGFFILHANDQASLCGALQTFRSWNPGWNPEFVTCDYKDDLSIAAVRTFSDSFITISESSRQENWQDWVNDPTNNVLDVKDELIEHLQAIANSHSEKDLNASARTLEESFIWKNSERLREWFQTCWLANAKMWVWGYHPEEYLIFKHIDHNLMHALSAINQMRVHDRSYSLTDLIIEFLENIAPNFERKYWNLNKASHEQKVLLSSQFPVSMHHLPGKVATHIWQRMHQAQQQECTVIDMPVGQFSVRVEDRAHTCSFGDSTSLPTCDCQDFQHFKLPCLHFCAVFNCKASWDYGMLPESYRSNPILNLDWFHQFDEFKVNKPPAVEHDESAESCSKLLLQLLEHSKCDQTKRSILNTTLSDLLDSFLAEEQELFKEHELVNAISQHSQPASITHTASELLAYESLSSCRFILPKPEENSSPNLTTPLECLPQKTTDEPLSKFMKMFGNKSNITLHDDELTDTNKRKLPLFPVIHHSSSKKYAKTDQHSVPPSSALKNFSTPAHEALIGSEVFGSNSDVNYSSDTLESSSEFPSVSVNLQEISATDNHVVDTNAGVIIVYCSDIPSESFIQENTIVSSADILSNDNL